MLLAACLSVVAVALSKTDTLSCERQAAPRAAQVRFFKAAAAVSQGRADGDTALATLVPKGPARTQLLKLADAEHRYHMKALQLAESVPPLVCDGPFPTAH